VAKNGDKVVGFCSTIRRDVGIVIDLIAIDPDCFGLGYGRKLVSSVIASYPKASSIQVGTQKNNVASLMLYKSCGFEKIRTAETYHWSPIAKEDK
jgi:ribosomal protein S18 acetylase RimI-like enzyme